MSMEFNDFNFLESTHWYLEQPATWVFRSAPVETEVEGYAERSKASA